MAGVGQQAAPELQLRIRQEKVNHDELDITLLKFEVFGLLAKNEPVRRPEFRLSLTDCTTSTVGNDHSVLTIIDDLQANDSNRFEFSMDMPEQINVGAHFTDWVQLTAVPLEALIFPESGNRRIMAKMVLRDLSSNRVVAIGTTSWNLNVESGYLEQREQEGEAQAACLKLAMCIAAEDGAVDHDEVAVIKKWGEKSVKELDKEIQFESHAKLNEALKVATAMIRSRATTELFNEAVAVLNGLKFDRFKYDAYELCLNVLKADGKAHPAEMASINRLAKQLGLDEKKVRIMTDRHTANIEFTIVDGAENDDDKFLGITPDMNKEEIKSLLNKLFKKHSARASHDDPNIANKSREWLEKIGNARVRHFE